MTWGEVLYGDELRKSQKLTLRGKTNAVQKSNEELVRLLEQEHKKVSF